MRWKKSEWKINNGWQCFTSNDDKNKQDIYVHTWCMKDIKSIWGKLVYYLPNVFCVYHSITQGRLEWQQPNFLGLRMGPQRIFLAY